MNVTARELAMAFLEGRPLEKENSTVTQLQYTISGIPVAKWDDTKLLITSGGFNHKFIAERLNALLEAYDCGVILSEIRGKLFFLNETLGESTPMYPTQWYSVSKKGFITSHE